MITINPTLKTVHRLSTIVSLPDFVKKSSIEDDLSNVASDNFADMLRREYPCHTKAATYVSAMELFSQVSENESGQFNEKQAQVRDRLMKFVGYWGLENEIANMLEGVVKTASLSRADLEKDFAIDFQYGDEHIQLYPMPNGASVKMAAQGLVAHRDNFPFHVRKVAAERILEKVAAFDVKLDTEVHSCLEETASKWPIDKEKLARAIERRLRLGEHQHTRNRGLGFETARENLESHYDNLPNGVDVEKVASAIETFDLESTLYTKYAWGLPLPEQMIFSRPEEKKASETIRLQNGKSFNLDEITKAGSAPFSILGSDFLDAVVSNGILSVEKIAAILPTLPLNDAALLEKSLSCSGVKPCS